MTENTLPPLLRTSRGPQSLWRRILLISGALGCFLLGIFGWLLPVVTGIPFYVAGLVLLGIASPPVRRWINRIEARLPLRWRRLLRAGLDKIPFRKVRENLQH
jgi:hypothetical protein